MRRRTHAPQRPRLQGPRARGLRNRLASSSASDGHRVGRGEGTRRTCSGRAESESRLCPRCRCGLSLVRRCRSVKRTRNSQRRRRPARPPSDLVPDRRLLRPFPGCRHLCGLVTLTPNRHLQEPRRPRPLGRLRRLPHRTPHSRPCCTSLPSLCTAWHRESPAGRGRAPGRHTRRGDAQLRANEDSAPTSAPRTGRRLAPGDPQTAATGGPKPTADHGHPRPRPLADHGHPRPRPPADHGHPRTVATRGPRPLADYSHPRTEANCRPQPPQTTATRRPRPPLDRGHAQTVTAGPPGSPPLPSEVPLLVLIKVSYV